MSPFSTNQSDYCSRHSGVIANSADGGLWRQSTFGRGIYSHLHEKILICVAYVTWHNIQPILIKSLTRATSFAIIIHATFSRTKVSFLFLLNDRQLCVICCINTFSFVSIFSRWLWKQVADNRSLRPRDNIGETNIRTNCNTMACDLLIQVRVFTY